MQTSLLWSTKMKTAVKPESHELGNKKLTNSELQKHLIILAKKTQDRVWRSVVFELPLQQSFVGRLHKGVPTWSEF